MTHRIVGIDLNENDIRAVQIVRDGDGFRVERTCYVNIDSSKPDDDVVGSLQQIMREKGFDHRATAAAAIGDRHVVYRRGPVRQESDVTSAQESALDLDFPVSTNTLIIDSLDYHDPLSHNRSCHHIGVDRDYLDRLLNGIEGAGLRCESVDASPFCLCAAIGSDHPEIMSGSAILIYQDKLRLLLVVLQEGEVILLRRIAAIHEEGNEQSTEGTDNIQREIELTWRAALGEQIPEMTTVVLVDSENSLSGLIHIMEHQYRCRVIRYNPGTRVGDETKAVIGPDYCIALGAAIRGAAPENHVGLNFAQVRVRHHRRRQAPKKELVIFIGLAVVTVLILVGSMGIRRARLEKQYAALTGEIRNVFRQTLPDEGEPVDALSQLETKLAVKRQQADRYQIMTGGAGTQPLDVLSILSSGVAKVGKIVIEEYNETEDKVTVVAVSGSFESVRKWQKVLEDSGIFSMVKVGDIRKQADGDSVRFSLEMSLNKEQQ